MANLGDSIRLTTVADLQALSELVNEYKKLGLSISGVAGASRIVYEQIKRDALEQANTTKQAILQNQLSTAELNKQSAELRKNNLELKAQTAALNELKKSSDGLFSSLSGLSGLRSQLIGLFGAMSVGAFAKDIIDAQSQVEAFGLSMNNLLGQKYGEKLVSDLKKFTVETPLNFEDVIKSSNQLVGSFKAAGASSREIGDEIPKILESLGNSAAALGGDGRLGRLTYAFSQVQATGRLMGTEVRQITETGFPLLAVMSQTTGKSVQELQKDITAGKVSFEQFKTAILSAGKEGGVFAGAMDIMANTVRGRLDKLSETFFFAKARIGDALTSSAKSAIDFGNALIKSLFGTDEATKNTIEYIKQLVFLGATLKLIAGYEAALATGKRILNVLELAGNVIRTQGAVVAAAAAGNTMLLAKAELEAAAATRVFSATVSSSTLGAFLFVIGAAIGAYELYKSNLEEVNELTFDNIKATDSDVKALMTKQSQLNATANSALGLSEETAGYRLQVGKLIKQYPEYFGNLDEEKASHDDIRKALFFANNEMERKIKLMVQEKLAEKLADRSADLKIQIAQEEIAAQTILDKRIEYQKKQLELKKKGLADEYTEQLGAYEFDRKSLDESNKKLAELKGKDVINQKLQQKATNNLLASEQEDYQIRHNAIIKKWNDKGFETRKQFTDAITALDEEYGYGQRKRAEVVGKAAKEAGEKALKYQKDTNEQIKIASEKIFAEGLEDSRQKDLLLRNVEYRNQQERIKNAIGSQKLKNKALLDLEQEYDADVSKIIQTWSEKELKATEEKNKSLATLEKNRYELSEKLRILNLILAAKSSDEIQRIEEDAADNILRENKNTAEKQVAIEVAKLKEIADKGREGTLEYIEQDKIVLDSKNKLAEAEIKFTDLTLKFKRKATKEEEDLINKLQKLDENNAIESVELEGDKQELIGKLRKLELISKAKNSKEATEIENIENEKTLRINVESSKKKLSQAKALLESMTMLGQNNTEEYIKQQGVVIKAEQIFTNDQIKLTEFLTDKKKDALDKQYDFTAQSIVDLVNIYKKLNDGVEKSSEELQIILQKREKAVVGATLFLANFAMDAISNIVDRNISKTTDGIRKIQLEHNKAVLGLAQQATSAAMSFLSGDIAGGITKGLGALVSGIGLIGTKSAATSKYWTDKSIEELEDYGKRVESEVDRIVSRIDDIKEAYGEIKLESGATIGGTLSKDLGLDAALKSLWEVGKSIKEISTDIINIPPIDLSNIGLDFKTLDEWRIAIGTTGRSVDELIQAEIARGQRIQKTYEDAVDSEDKLHEKNISNNQKTYDDKIDKFEKQKDEAIKSTNEIYDNEIKRINESYNQAVKNINSKYDLEDTRATQKYDKETLSILSAGSKQLEGLITNEISLNSVRDEFAGKRQFILDSYALANKAITSDMTEEEVAGINNAIKARDEALAKLQKWYNDELTFIVNSEGQKRKEYSATEAIQNGINDRLEKAAILFNANEIKRNANKNVELAIELAKKETLEADAERKKNSMLGQIDREFKEASANALKDFNIAKEIETKRNVDILTALEKKKDEDIATSFKILTELLKVYAEDIAKAMEDSTAKGSEAYKKLAQELNVVNELLKQIRSNSGSEPLNIGINGGLNITPFAKGTDNLSTSMSGTPKAGKTGGWLIEGHEGEAIFSKPNMDEMTRFLGKRPTRDEVINRFKMGTKLIDSNSFIQKISPYVINKSENNNNTDVRDLTKKIERLTKEVVKRQQPMVTIDKNGIRTYVTNINSQIEIKNQKFSS